MKQTSYFLCLVAFFLAGYKATAQQVTCDSVYTLAEQMPVYGKGQNDFFEYLNKNLEIKKPCKSGDIKRILFTIDKLGKLNDIDVVGVSGKCREDLIRQLKQFPDWTPGKDLGNTVCVRIIMPIQLKEKSKEPKEQKKSK